jgi:hypothetical protein
VVGEAWAWVCSTPGRVVPAERSVMLGLEAGRTARSRWTWRPVAGVLVCLLSSVICPLPSARIWGLPPFGLLEPGARLGLGVGEFDEKGIWWMPWHREAMKDVARCEKPRGGASARGSSDLRMGQPTP